jgi:hypothetical protein
VSKLALGHEQIHLIKNLGYDYGLVDGALCDARAASAFGHDEGQQQQPHFFTFRRWQQIEKI